MKLVKKPSTLQEVVGFHRNLMAAKKLDQKTLPQKKVHQKAFPFDYPLVEIRWVDANTSYGWEEITDKIAAENIVHCISIGFLIKETESEYVLAQTIEGDDCNGTIAIPAPWVFCKKEL